MNISVNTHITYWKNCIFLIFSCGLLLSYPITVNATGQECYQRGADRICPEEEQIGTLPSPDSENQENTQTTDKIDHPCAEDKNYVYNAGCSVALKQEKQLSEAEKKQQELEELKETFQQEVDDLLKSILQDRINYLLGQNPDSGQLSQGNAALENILSGVRKLNGMVCGNGTQLNGDFAAFARNAAAQAISRIGSLNKIGGYNPGGDICRSLSNITGGPGGVAELSIDALGKGGGTIAECAQKSIGTSTKTAATHNGKLGCAYAVSLILKCAKYDVGTHVGTGALYAALSKDPCYKIVDTGHITASEAGSIQPGDVLVTKRGGRAGHTGIYIGGGKIVSNSSSSGSIKQNYTLKSWSSVTGRNPSGSAVFRRVCS